MLSDSELFDFNAALITDYDDERAHAALETYGDTFRYQLVAAKHMDAWAASLQEPDNLFVASLDPKGIDGYVNALLNIAATIRMCGYLPGGDAFEDVQSRQV